jgi:hypothetical protein
VRVGVVATCHGSNRARFRHVLGGSLDKIRSYEDHSLINFFL